MAEATTEYLERIRTRSIYITVLWVALNEDCDAMNNPRVQRIYVAYSFLSYSGAELETPNSLPKPEHYMDKCYFNFEKSKCIMVSITRQTFVAQIWWYVISNYSLDLIWQI